MKDCAKKILCLAVAVTASFAAGCGKKDENKVTEVGILSKTMTELEMGETDELSVMNYTGEIKWSSSDKNVVTVSENGVLSAVATGTAAITAELDYGEALTCVVEVNPGKSDVKSIKVTSNLSTSSDITVKYSEMKSIQMKARCDVENPNEKITWSSSNEKTATVNADGLVTLKGNGMVEIKAAAVNGVEGVCILRIKGVPETTSDAPQTQNATEDAQVPVIEKENTAGKFTSPVPTGSPAAKSVVVVSDRYVYLNVAEHFALTYAVGNTDDKSVEWSSSDRGVAIVNDGTIVATGEGRATISVVTNDGAVAHCFVAVGDKAAKELKSEAKGN